MSQFTDVEPGATTNRMLTYNLWTEPWIDTLDRDGNPRRFGIRDCLVEAHQLTTFTDPSPLVVASLQRLLAAIVQAAYHQPRSIAALAEIVRGNQFDLEVIDQFGRQYAHRFDLFSLTEPFLQTADISPDLPRQRGGTKPVGYLFPEAPTGTNINHFFHSFDEDYQFSPATAALGLITLPAFATSGGAGIKPSINGVPPLYVLPVGSTIFETLALSIITPGYQPRIAADEDRPAWARDPVVERGREVWDVGYLESLTFPARRVRLFPEAVGGRCSRSGEQSSIIVRRMVFEMGASRPKGAAPWFDPFAAYRLREKEGPVPIRPVEGKVLWREYGNLFQTIGPASQQANAGVAAPRVVEQLARLQPYLTCEDDALWRFRCIGLRTDMKAKVFEWVDESLDVGAGILSDPAGQLEVQEAVQRVEGWARRVVAMHRSVYDADDHDQFDHIRRRMLSDYWGRLADPFRRFVLLAAKPEARQEAFRRWTIEIFTIGEQVLIEAAEEAGERGERIRQRAELLTKYRIARAGQRKEWLP